MSEVSNIKALLEAGLGEAYELANDMWKLVAFGQNSSCCAYAVLRGKFDVVEDISDPLWKHTSKVVDVLVQSFAVGVNGIKPIREYEVDIAISKGEFLKIEVRWDLG